MGTRADFYVGRGPDARWLGSVGYDGHHDNFGFLLAATKVRHNRAKKFRQIVNEMLRERDDSTFPKDGWPWPWPDSCLTDVAYAYDNGHVYATEHWFEPYAEMEKNHPCTTCTHGRKAWVDLAVHRKATAEHSRLYNRLTRLQVALEEVPERCKHKRAEIQVRVDIAQLAFDLAGGDEYSERAPRICEAVFPDMKAIQNVTLGKGSGLLIVGM